MLKNIKGLKYPDEYFIKFFFKYQLHTNSNLKYLELGCSNGCNIMLPFQFDNSVVGVDLDSTLIDNANYNFESLDESNSYKFYKQDMREFCVDSVDINADILVLANSIYYIPQNDFIKMIRDIKQNNLIKNNIPFFIRFRDLDDFRNNKGKIIESNSIIMQNGITGEDGLFCKFYDSAQMIQILKDELDLKDFEVMSIKYDNIQNNAKVNNSDVVIWGIIN